MRVDHTIISRQRFLRQVATSVAMTIGLAWLTPFGVEAFSVPSSGGANQPSWRLRSSASESITSNSGITNGFAGATSAGTVAYRSLLLPMDEFGVQVPIACWFPVTSMEHNGGSYEGANPNSGRLMMEYPLLSKQISASSLFYQHRISVKRIGQLLAGWDFIPEFVARDFQLQPTLTSTVTDGQNTPLPSRAPVVFLAHGYLGSRFDLSHLAEELARQGNLIERCVHL